MGSYLVIESVDDEGPDRVTVDVKSAFAAALSDELARFGGRLGREIDVSIRLSDGWEVQTHLAACPWLLTAPQLVGWLERSDREWDCTRDTRPLWDDTDAENARELSERAWETAWETAESV